MNFDLKLGKAASVVFLALAMVGCGGGGSTTTMPEPPPMPDPAIAERQAISDAIGDAETAVAAVNDTSDAGTVTAAEMAVADARSAIMAGTNVPQHERNANSGTVDAIESRLNAAKNSRSMAMKEADDKAKMAAKAMAAKLYAGLATEAADADTATNALAAATISISGMNVSGDADGAGTDEEAVTIKPSGTAVSALNGWMGMDYVRKTTNPMLTDHVVLYSNRGAPKTELFATKYATQLAEDTNAGRLNDTYLTAAANQGNIASDMFASGSGFKEHTESNGDVAKIRGTFDGALGYYHCSQSGGTACRSTVNGSGGIALAGGWSFEPDDKVMASTPDADYVIFGWWSREVSAGVDVATFAQTVGADLAGTANVALTGTAMYVGGAAGKYSINEPVEGNPESGAFTARAELTAKFGTAATDGTGDGTISGMLTDFMAGGMAKDWTVALKGAGTEAEAAIAADGFGGDGTASSTVWSIDGTAASASGMWSGDFYYDTAAQQTAANTPPAAAGTFTATYGNVGRMVGAFGATKQ